MSKQPTSNLLKYGTLFIITIQTSTMVLLLRYSRKRSILSGEAYLNSTAVLLSELLKLVICLIVLHTSRSLGGISYVFRNDILGKPRETLKIFIPAFLYTVQNNLLFLALSNLDAASYQVTYQFKIITTALFSVALLHKRLSSLQWLSLFTLMCGVTLVQWPHETAGAVISQGDKNIPLGDKNILVSTNSPLSEALSKSQASDSATLAGNESRLIGFIAVVLSSFSSGFSGVYFEKLLKFNSQSLWVRNTQLAVISCFLSMFTIISNDYNAVVDKGFFQGYDVYTWCVIVLQAFGGICVSLVMKYADNILKGFATTISIIISSICSYYMFADFVPSHLFFLGTILVVFSTMLYSL